MKQEKDVTEEINMEEQVSADPEGSDSQMPDNSPIQAPEEQKIRVPEAKDYLDPSLFKDIKKVTYDELESSAGTDKAVDAHILARYSETVSDIAEHQIVRGRVIGQNEKEIIMDIGFKSEGSIPRSDFSGKEMPAIGDVLDVYLERMEDRSGQTILSKEKAEWMQSWNRIVDIYNKGETLNGRIIRRIKGGMVVEIDGIQAFLPGSQIDVRPVQDFDQYLGQEMEFKIVKVNRLRKNIVLSRKALLENALREQRASLFKDIEAGQILEGRVKNITDFGVFIDLGGVDGLLHITDLSWGRVNHPSEMVELGETLNVKVIDVDRERQRISLGLKQLTPHPWDSVAEKYPARSKVTGKVVSMTNYGAFVEIEKGVEGLVHVSEMSWTRNVHHPSQVVQLGDTVEAQVLSVNPEERKIALGFKELQPDPWEGVEVRYPVDSLHRGTVRNLTQFGAFVELEEGVDGLIHISDLSWTKVVRHPKEVVEKDQEVEVRILEVSEGSRRIALGLRQATEDPWPSIAENFSNGKIVSGEVIRVLEKGVILQLEMDVEGIIPSRTIPRKDRKEILAKFLPGTAVSGEVVRVEPDDKKVVLSLTEIPEEKENAASQDAPEPGEETGESGTDPDPTGEKGSLASSADESEQEQVEDPRASAEEEASSSPGDESEGHQSREEDGDEG
ncbi:MAG: 30S ribosomal protein S1 [Fidelibacterota bacterium]